VDLPNLSVHRKGHAGTSRPHSRGIESVRCIHASWLARFYGRRASLATLSSSLYPAFLQVEMPPLLYYRPLMTLPRVAREKAESGRRQMR
jgi:hypothetical protein